MCASTREETAADRGELALRWLCIRSVVILTALGACGHDDETSTSKRGNGSSETRGDNEFGSGDGGIGLDPAVEIPDPVTCEEAKTSKSYLGCDYWPTLMPSVAGYGNAHPSSKLGGCPTLNFGIVVANTGKEPAAVTVTGPNNFNAQVTVAADQSIEIDLPGVPDAETQETAGVASGAFHLVSSVPVVVYEFNPFNFTAKCKLSTSTATADAMLLSPTSALTGTYRVMGSGTTAKVSNRGAAFFAVPTLTVTATAEQTTVTVKLGGAAAVIASKSGPSIPAASANGTLSFTLSKPGDIAQIVGAANSDFSGSLVQANSPVQVTTASGVANKQGTVMLGAYEEVMLPAEALGKEYIVASPPPSTDGARDHIVRLYGNVDGTTLTYLPAKPAGCPDSIDAGQFVDCDLVGDSFQVRGSAEFGVMSFVRDPYEAGETGSQTGYQSVEQFRKKYVFMGYEPPPTWHGDGITWANATGPKDAGLVLDGVPIDPSTWKQVGDGPLGVYQINVSKSAKKGGPHVLTSDQPVGVQIIGKDYPTSFAYPAGLNLKPIAPPPVK